ncbi:histidinol-phosphate transaminase [Spirosoma sp.]|uniref:histidinol-phosphate transaminase n=1 Tax=Spirosoma sp. TaxID=1899569 RepID=UPI003B3A4EDE
MFTLQSILRPHILSLTPYSSARDEYTGKVGVFLDANENPIGSTTDTGDYNRYPDPHQLVIKQKLAPIKEVRPEQIFLGNGSDEPIDLLVRATCVPGKDNMLIMPPTYGMYEVSAAVNDVDIIKVPLTPDFQVDVQAVLAAITERTKLIWLCSPNNPSGNLLQDEAIRTILDAANHSLVIVDEAYIDFADTPSWTTQLDTYPNLVVLQTFSKAWGLAALRLGMCFASEELINVLNKIKPPYNISAPTQRLAFDALSHEAAKNEMVTKILAARQKLAENLRSLPSVQGVHPSDANFLLVKFDQAKQVFDHLIDQQVIVRDRSKVKLCDNCLRISVGTDAENERLLDVLRRMSSSPVPANLPLGSGEEATRPEFVSNV